MKTQKGITLIALIITIIVMLLLVGVTINVALNGGIFDKATKAKEDTQRETDKEQLLAAIVATVDNNGNFNLENLELPEGFTYDDTTGIYTGPTGKEYTVDKKTGKVKEYKEEQVEESFTFTIGDILENGFYQEGSFGILESNFWPEEVSNELKNSKTINNDVSTEDYTIYYFNNLVCSYETLEDVSSQNISNIEGSNNSFMIISSEMDGNAVIALGVQIENVILDDTNYQNYPDLTFTITK
ncbi:MAG: hypothetical protein J5507_05815 [Clostridia bacterium]|nr:hypothetical protein [Clostridia bacterium]